MEKLAKEELEMLDALYPHRFQYLKLELQSFISPPHPHPHPHPSHHHPPQPSHFVSSMPDTQESSSSNQRKRKKKKSTVDGASDPCKHDECHRTDSCSGSGTMMMMKKKKKKRDRVDVVLEKAEACLKKIQRFKATLLCDSCEN